MEMLLTLALTDTRKQQVASQKIVKKDGQMTVVYFVDGNFIVPTNV